MSISVELTNEEVETIERAFASSRFKTREELAPALLRLAAKAWLRWISGEKRYNSLTEQYTDWIEQIYHDFFPQEPPNTDWLFNFLNVPYGQAQYIARVLSNRETARWRTDALNGLKAKLLEKKKGKAGSWTDQSAGIVLKLFKPEMIELRRIFEELGHESPQDIKIPGRSGWGNWTEVTMNPSTFKKVCDRLGIKEE